MSAVNRLRWCLEAKTSVSQPKSPEILTTSNPNQRADNVNRRTSESITLCRRNEMAGIDGICLFGIVNVSESIEMPSSSQRNSQSAPIAAMKQTMPAIMRLPVAVAVMEKKQNPRSATANSKAKIFQLRNRPAA
jgi:hypothetical protein